MADVLFFFFIIFFGCCCCCCCCHLFCFAFLFFSYRKFFFLFHFLNSFQLFHWPQRAADPSTLCGLGHPLLVLRRSGANPQSERIGGPALQTRWKWTKKIIFYHLLSLSTLLLLLLLFFFVCWFVGLINFFFSNFQCYFFVERKKSKVTSQSGCVNIHRTSSIMLHVAAF